MSLLKFYLQDIFYILMTFTLDGKSFVLVLMSPQSCVIYFWLTLNREFSSQGVLKAFRYVDEFLIVVS